MTIPLLTVDDVAREIQVPMLTCMRYVAPFLPSSGITRADLDAAIEVLPSAYRYQWDSGKAPGRVYIIEAVGSGAVKIGWAKHVRSRMRHLQTCCPLLLVPRLVVPGTLRAEWLLHRRFADLRVSHTREWFQYEGPLVSYVAAMQVRTRGLS